MDTTEQKVDNADEFQTKCQGFVERMAGAIIKDDTLGVTVNGALHFAGFMLAQHIKSQMAERAVDLQTEINLGVGVLASATAHNLHLLESPQADISLAANETKH